jgi:hypothetical protein
MQKLPAVEEARRILNAGREWSIWRWLIEKSKVRRAADAGTAALDELEERVKTGWSAELKKAYRELQAAAALNGNAKARREYEKAKAEASGVDAGVKAAIAKVKEADDIAYEARMDAEAMFAEAERRLSGSLAREAAERALEAYDLREKAIRRAESAGRVRI